MHNRARKSRRRCSSILARPLQRRPRPPRSGTRMVAHQQRSANSGERTRLACWFWRLAKTIFWLFKVHESGPLLPAREPRALLRIRPGLLVRDHSRTTYGVVAGAAGAGELKLNCTGGGFSAPGCAVKNGFGGNPSIPAIKFVGKLRTATL